MSNLVVDVLAGAVGGGTAIMYAGLGETISERAGVINLGTEGSMLGGALAAYAATATSGSPWVGVLAGMGAGAALAAVHAVLVVARKANQFASGLTVMFFALGLTSLFGAAYVGRQIHALNPWKVPGLSAIPWVGPILFDHDPLTYLSFAVAPLVWWLLYKSRVGLLIRTAGEHSEVLLVHGYSTSAVRYVSVIAGGGLCGLGGAQLSIAYSNAWFENMTVGRGFIAVALVIFATWNPLRVMAGSYLFGAALALSPALQARGYGINQFALDAIPFVVTILVLAVLGRRTLLAAPDELRRVFETRAA
ncbi:ABC transporter permease [Pseudofrankia asymbiotica]|uniref:ABC transporter permease n=1 Tax=Pseudofrankia asymbiotica TaxID=1834516 RepID=A0A1V2I4M0_9ACTN|nr:ABC transporter permease [Pseudofrankia asymbiotica]ONH25837.1 ABC transporter permease [Pseudofrankia asymbiotica]